MFSFGKKKPGPVLGVDINSDSTTLVQLEKSRLGIELARFACLPTPANTIKEGLIADPSTIGQVILDLMQQAGVPPGGPSPVINMTVPAQAVVIRLMPVPTGMPPDELAEVVTQEATNHVPFPISDANIDWSLMPATERTDSDGVRRVDVILAAVQRSLIDTCWRTADSAGVKLGKVEVSSLAAIRALALAGYLGSTGFISMVVNIRQDATDINVLRSAMPLFGRSVIIGIETLTEAVSRSLECDFEIALGLLPELPLFGVTPQDQRMGQAAQVARTIFSDITDELERSLDFYQSQVGDIKLDQIVLTGPGCMVPNLDQYIKSRMGYKTIFGDIMRDMIFDKALVVDRMRPILASLIGSAVEPTWNTNYTVELDLNKEGRVPVVFDERKTQIIEERRTVGRRWYKPALILGIVALAMTFAAYAYFSLYEVPRKNSEMQDLNLKIMETRLDLESISKLRETNKSLRLRSSVLNYLVRKSKKWSSYMDAISDNTPKGVQIDHIVFSTGNLQIEGFATDFSSVSQLALGLETSPLIGQSSIDYATRNSKTPDIVSFSMTAKLKSRPLPVPPPPRVTSYLEAPGLLTAGTETFVLGSTVRPPSNAPPNRNAPPRHMVPAKISLNGGDLR